MSESSAYRAECVVLAFMLKYPEESCLHLLPALKSNKFKFSMHGDRLSQDHRDIFQAITLAWGDNKVPTIALLTNDYLNDSYRPYLQSLYNRLERLYHIYGYSGAELESYAETVHRNGVITGYIAWLKAKGLLVNSEEELDKYLAGVGSFDEWAAGIADSFSGLAMDDGGMYMTAGEIVEEVRDTENTDEESEIIPCGVPSIDSRFFTILDHLLVLHGDSSSGKSTLLKQASLGAAIGLVDKGIEGSIVIHSLDESKKRFVQDCAFLLTGVSPRGLRGQSPENQKIFDEAFDYVGTLPILVADKSGKDEMNMTNMQLALKGVHQGSKGPVWMVGTDYLQDVEAGDWRGQREDQFFGYVASRHKKIVSDTGASVWLLSQTTYPQGDIHRIGGPSGPRGARAIRQAADVIVEVYNTVEMRNAGQRFEVPEGLAEGGFYLLNQKFRGGRKFPPTQMIWDNGRIVDIELDGAESGIIYSNQLENPDAPLKPPGGSGFDLFLD